MIKLYISHDIYDKNKYTLFDKSFEALQFLKIIWYNYNKENVCKLTYVNVCEVNKSQELKYSKIPITRSKVCLHTWGAMNTKKKKKYKIFTQRSRGSP